MKWSGSSEGQQGIVGRVGTVSNRNAANGIRHLLDRDVEEAEEKIFGRVFFVNSGLLLKIDGGFSGRL